MQIKHKQQGATLIIAMVFLLILTLLGISSMSNSALEARMAHNLKLKNQISAHAEGNCNAFLGYSEFFLKDSYIENKEDVTTTNTPSFTGSCTKYNASLKYCERRLWAPSQTIDGFLDNDYGFYSIAVSPYVGAHGENTQNILEQDDCENLILKNNCDGGVCGCQIYRVECQHSFAVNAAVDTRRMSTKIVSHGAPGGDPEDLSEGQ